MTTRAARSLVPARRVVGIVAASMLPMLTGCLVFPCFTSARTGALLPGDPPAAPRAGTPRREVLDAFGPPLAVARRGGGAVRVPEVGLRASGAAEIPEELFFERFGDLAGPADVVYFYRAHELVTSGSGVLLVVGNQGDLVGTSRDVERDDRLWVLVDGGTGLVKAHVHERDEPPAPRREVDAEEGEDSGGGP